MMSKNRIRWIVTISTFMSFVHMPPLEEDITKATVRNAKAYALSQIEHSSDKSANEADALQDYRMELYGLQAAKTPAICSVLNVSEDATLKYAAAEVLTLAAENSHHNGAVAALPNILISDDTDLGVIEVGKDLLIGAIDELTNHPGRVLASAAIGLGVGVGATFVSPVAITVGLVGAVGYGLYTLSNKVPTWIDAAKVVASPNEYSMEQKVRAHCILQDVGAGTVSIVASGIGALGSAPATSVIKCDESRVFAEVESRVFAA